MKLVECAVAAAAVLLGSAASAQAAVMIAPVSVKIDEGGVAGMFWKAENMINQSGLSANMSRGSLTSTPMSLPIRCMARG